MIKAQIDDKNCKILLKGIENNGKNMSRAMRTIAVELGLIGALYELR